ncbi:hypothetical protein GH714_010575 [Hevea brasiliensis]|uniref:Uncharacterized protein n=1 Tax=Hevea brasiliensis TaxID=3981 RepID=A0A6A6M6U1_HEVBR|nr:hypothetical protein GH714_010575 [Hevea brasiliensis]
MLDASKSSSSYEPLSRTDNGNKTPLQARRGYIAIYVGEEAERYEVPVENLRFPPLQELIKQSRDYDLDSKIDGPITSRLLLTVNSLTLLPIFTINIANGVGLLSGAIQLTFHACYYKVTLKDEDDDKPVKELQPLAADAKA